MPTLRLLDGNGYVVPRTDRTVTTDADRAAVTAELDGIAEAHAAELRSHGFRCQARDYRIVTLPAA
jgi:hypothetical protein